MHTWFHFQLDQKSVDGLYLRGFDSNLLKRCKITALRTFLLNDGKCSGQWFGAFFGDWVEMKEISEIKVPLAVHVGKCTVKLKLEVSFKNKTKCLDNMHLQLNEYETDWCFLQRQCWFMHFVRFVNANANVKLFVLQKSKQFQVRTFVRKSYKTRK